MIFKKVEIVKVNSTELTVLENVNVWFASNITNNIITLYIGDMVFTNIKVKHAFWLSDTIEFKTIDDLKDIDLFKIKAYL